MSGNNNDNITDGTPTTANEQLTLIADILGVEATTPNEKIARITDVLGVDAMNSAHE